MRVVEWNIERGARLEGIISVLNSHEVLARADLLLLNELDCGMARSGNINVARELVRALSAHAVYGAEYLEMTKGVREELNLPGENADALHGNAILTRHHFSNPEIVRLPRCENNFESREKRLGGRIGICLDIEIRGMKLTAATTHLDVVNTPRCRAKQMRAFLQYIESRAEESSEASAKIIMGGDLNTHTFARGGPLRTAKNVVKIFASDPERLARSLLHPERKEPAIREFTRSGYEVEALNDRAATSRSIVSKLDDASRLPNPLRGWVMRRIGPSGLLLEFRLDWLAARGLRPLEDGEAIDRKTGATSVCPQTIAGLRWRGSPLSDHDPIVVDLALT
ncbi:MAG: endonuclease/exonuclease/phosphatase family protein [Blastocatellia bacterium]|nr:endonuclease/exonuclease/phosphatase family protein [Blastocatellia bacterium]